MRPGSGGANHRVLPMDLLPSRPSRRLPASVTFDLSSDDDDSLSLDAAACDWLDSLPSQGPVTLTQFDRELWESLLDSGRSGRAYGQLRRLSSNGNNNRRGPTSEEPIPTSTPTALELIESRSLFESIRPAVVQRRLDRTQSLSPSATPGAFRLVNWAAEPSDQRWNSRCYQGLAAAARRKGAWRRPKVLPKQISPRGVGAPGHGKPQMRHPARRSQVNGVEIFLSSVPDSSPHCGAAAGGEWVPTVSQFDCPTPCRKRHRIVRTLVSPKSQASQQQQVPVPEFRWRQQLGIRNAATAGSQDVSASHCRIPPSDTPLKPRRYPASSNLTMEFSGNSSSSSSRTEDEGEEGAEAEVVDEATLRKFRGSPQNQLPVRRPTNLDLFKARRNMVISVSGCQLRTASKTVSTMTERSASTLLAGGSEGVQSTGALEARPPGLKRYGSMARRIPRLFNELTSDELNEKAVSLKNETWRKRSRPPPPREPLLALQLCKPQFHLESARMLVRQAPLSIAPLWLSQADETSSTCVASIRPCPTDASRFTWQISQLARGSQVCCQLLFGPVDNSQSSESRLALHRCPVYANYREKRRTLQAINTIDWKLIGVGIGMAAPEVETALRYVAPSGELDPWLNLPNTLEPVENQSTPLALPWPRAQVTMPEWTCVAVPSEPVLPLPVPSIVFHAAPKGSEQSIGWNFPTGQQPSSSLKAQQLRELRRIVRMRMRRKVRDNEFICVPDTAGWCGSSSSSMAAPTLLPAGNAEEPKRPSIQASTTAAEGLEHQVAAGLLDSLRSSRQTAAAVAAEVANAQRQGPGCGSAEQLANLAQFVERILQESCNQQAALNDLLAALRSRVGGSAKGGTEGSGMGGGFGMAVVTISQDLEASARTVTTISPGLRCPESSSSNDASTGQFFSVAGTATDAGTRATLHTADQFYSPPVTTNNNAEDASTETATGAATGRLRHRTYYACRRFVHLEESAAILVQQPAWRASSVVAACPIQLDGPTVSCSASNTSAAVTCKTSTAGNRFTPESLRVLERRTLAQAWRRPRFPVHLLDQLDPTTSSFVWWSLLPGHLPLYEGHRRAHPAPSPASSSQTKQPEISMTAATITDATSLSDSDQAPTELNLVNKLSSPSPAGVTVKSPNFAASSEQERAIGVSVMTYC